MKKSINVLIIPTLQISIPMKVEGVDADLTTIFGSTETLSLSIVVVNSALNYIAYIAL